MADGTATGTWTNTTKPGGASTNGWAVLEHQRHRLLHPGLDLTMMNPLTAAPAAGSAPCWPPCAPAVGRRPTVRVDRVLRRQPDLRPSKARPAS